MVLAGGLAACGTVQQLSAADKVSKAFGKLGDGKTFKVELSVEATADQLVSFGKATGDPIERPAAEALAGLSLAVSVSADRPLKEFGAVKKGELDKLADDKSLALEYVLAGKDGKVYADMRQVDAKTYLKIDAEGIAKLAGEDPSEVRAMADEMPAELKVFKDALAGKWLTFDPKLLQELNKAPKGKSSTPSATPSVDPKVAEDLMNSVKDVFSRNLTFDDKGTKDGLDHVVVSAPARGLVNDLLKAFKPLSKDVPSFGKLPTAAPTDVPDTKIGVDVYLKDGALSSVTFDLAQLDEKAGPGVHLPVKAAFSKDAAAPQAPTGATEIKTSDIESIMTSFAKGPGGNGVTPAEPLTDAQIKELARSGMSEAQIKMMNAGGLGYQDIKDMLALKS
ncbi:hypothetical protein GCM10010193_38350 [Kitasatospora atroaurantiaca]|uniref:Uncharacterized protein n=1 Tax=Kitasatospora atroaurantiaca TaxID=285545 RepID=A0A561EUE0_9ACTN|nr:hypothetical protein [Kitasatospora atroaurantiaca]TWE19230.1 hypothetical protein FB465_4344 [Kitasatospora atroaurantiaca]